MTRQGPLLASAALALVLVGFANRGVAHDFNDSHFHLTNYIQEGLTLPEFLKIMGSKTGRAAVFGIPLQQKWDYFESAIPCPRLLSARRCRALLLLVHGRRHRGSVLASARGGSRADRSHDHRVQSHRHVRGRSHTQGAVDVSGRFLGHRRVFRPQGVRFLESGGAYGQPAQSGAGQDTDVRGRSRPGRDTPQRHQYRASHSWPARAFR